MALSSDLISQFVKITKDSSKSKGETTIRGTVVEYDGSMYVRLDGSELLTPVSTTVNTNPGDRVIVTIKNHSATVTGNTTNPSASSSDLKDTNDKVEDIGNQISEFEIIVADKVSTSELDAVNGRIDNLISDNVTIKDKLTANEAEIENLKAGNVTIEGELNASKAEIEELKTKKLDADTAEITFAKIQDLEATNAEIDNLSGTFADFKIVTADQLVALDATVKRLDAEKLSAEQADLKYANIDFANIGEAAIENFYAKSGVIQDVVISDGQVTGTLVGVTIKGDLIEGGTIVADKLVILGDDGLYYKLNTNGETVTSQQTEYNSLSGTIITAKSVTAEKIAVDDLVAFDATIGGFSITEHAIYSGVKSSVSNTTRGSYLDNTGQIAFGDSNNYLKYYKDSDGNWRLAISADSVSIGSSKKNVEESIDEAQRKADTAIIKSVEEFYQSTSPTELIGGSWSLVQPTWTEGTYIWRRAKNTYGNGEIEYSPSENGVCITGNTGDKGDKGDKGDTGATGATGATGKGVSKSEVYYYLSTSNTTQTGGSWSTTVPVWVDGSYYWQKIKTTYTDNTTAESTPVCITGAKGSTGATGQGVSSITTEFYMSTSKTTQTGGSWVTSMPTWSTGNYLWTRNKIVYKNPTSTVYTEPVCDSSWEAVNDVDKKIDDTAAGLRETITEQSTSIISDCEEIMLEALSSYVKSDEGVKVSNISIRYLASSSETDVTSSTEGWSSDLPTLSTDTPYLWVYEVIDYSDGKTKESQAVLLYTYDSLTISSITEYYAANLNEESPIKIVETTNADGTIVKTEEDLDWSTSIPDLSSSALYLWKYEHITLSDNSTVDTDKRYIGEYVHSYSEFKKEVETQMSVMAGEISMNFETATGKLEEIDGEMQQKFTEIEKHFKFTENGLEITAGENTMSIVVDNDIISFQKNGEQFGWWDGVDFHTGNIIVDVEERAQFGNFAFIPRSDGSLMFLKVGD